jgi:hypothetical protein
MATETTEQDRLIDSTHMCALVHAVRAPRFHLAIISVSPT